MTVLETMAEGIPSITTRIAAIPEAVEDGWNGILLHPGDVEDLAEAILGLMTDPALRTRLGENAYETARDQFSLEQHMEKLASIYREISHSDIEKQTVRI